MRMIDTSKLAAVAWLAACSTLAGDRFYLVEEATGESHGPYRISERPKFAPSGGSMELVPEEQYVWEKLASVQLPERVYLQVELQAVLEEVNNALKEESGEVSQIRFLLTNAAGLRTFPVHMRRVEQSVANWCKILIEHIDCTAYVDYPRVILTTQAIPDFELRAYHLMPAFADKLIEQNSLKEYVRYQCGIRHPGISVEWDADLRVVFVGAEPRAQRWCSMILPSLAEEDLAKLTPLHWGEGDRFTNLGTWWGEGGVSTNYAEFNTGVSFTNFGADSEIVVESPDERLTNP